MDDSEIELQEEESNPHGFLSAAIINDYKMTKSEKRKSVQDSNLIKEKYKHQQKKKTGLYLIYCIVNNFVGGSSNKEKLKKKPLPMVRPKKNSVKQ